MSKTTYDSSTTSDGSGGKGPTPKLLLIVQLLILLGIIYLGIMLSKKQEPKNEQYYKFSPYDEKSDTTASDGSGGKPPQPKLKADTLIIYRAADSAALNCPCCPQKFMMYSLTGTDTTTNPPRPH